MFNKTGSAFDVVEASIHPEDSPITHHNYIKSILENEKFQIITSPDGDGSRGVLLLQNNTADNNSIKIYNVVFSDPDDLGKFNITGYVNEVYGLDFISAKNGVSRINSIFDNGKSSAYDDLVYNIKESLSGRTVFGGTVQSSYNDLVGRSPIGTAGKVSMTKRFNPKKPVTFNLSEKNIIKALENTSDSFNNYESSSIFKALSQKYDLKNINEASKLKDALHQILIEKIIKGNTPFNNNSLYSNFNTNGFLNGGVQDFIKILDNRSSGVTDSFMVLREVKRRIYATTSNGSFLTKDKFSKIISDVSNVVGFDVTDTKRSLTSFEQTVIDTLKLKIDTYIDSNFDNIDSLLKSESPEKMKQVIKDIMNSVDTRATTISVVSELSGKNIEHNNDVTQLLSKTKKDLKPVLFHNSREQILNNSFFKNLTSHETDETILKKIEALKTSNRDYKTISEITNKKNRIQVYKYYQNTDAIFVSSNLNADELEVIKHLKGLKKEIINIDSGFKLSKSKPMANLKFSKYSYIGSFSEVEGKRLDSLLKAAQSNFKNNVYIADSTSHADIVGPKSPILNYRMSKDLKERIFDKNPKPIGRALPDLKIEIIKDLKSQGKSDSDIFAILDYYKGRGVRYSEGAKTKDNFRLNAAITHALNSISPSDINPNLEEANKAYDDFLNTKGLYSIDDFYGHKNVNILSKNNDAHIVNMLENAKKDFKKMVFFDIETTGFDKKVNVIDEISFVGPSGAVKTIKIDVSEKAYDELVNSSGFDGWSKARGFDKKTLKAEFVGNSKRVSREQAYSQIMDFLSDEAKIIGTSVDDLVFAGHNIDFFDIPFLQYEANIYNKQLSSVLKKSRTFDTYLDLFGNIFPNLKSRKLGDLYQEFVGEIGDKSLLHTAEYDVHINKQLLEKILGRVKNVSDINEVAFSIDPKTGKIINGNATKNSIYILDETTDIEFNLLKTSKIKNNSYDIKDLLNPEKILKIVNEKNSDIASVLESIKAKGFSVTYENGFSFLNVGIGPEATPIRVNLGKSNDFYNLHVLESNTGRSVVNDLAKEWGEIRQLRTEFINSGYSKNLDRLVYLDKNPLVLLTDENLKTIDDLNLFLKNKDGGAYVDLFDELDNTGTYSKTRLLDFLGRLKDVHKNSIDHIIDYITGTEVSSHGFSGKAGQLSRMSFFQSPFDFVNLGHGLSKESVRYYQSMDLKTLNPINLHKNLNYKESSVVGALEEPFLKSVKANIGDYGISTVKSRALIGYAPELWFEDSAVITKKAALSMDSVKEIKSVLNLKTISKDHLLKSYSYVAFKNGYSYNEMSKLSTSEDIYKYAKAYANNSSLADVLLLSEKAQTSLLLTSEKDIFIKKAIGKTRVQQQYLLYEFNSRISYIKDSLKSGSSLMSIRQGLETYTPAPHSYLPQSGTELIDSYYKSLNSLYSGTTNNSKISLFPTGINSSLKKLDGGLGYTGSHIENGNLIMRLTNTHFFASGDKLNFYGDKAAGTHIVDNIYALTSDNVKISLDLGMDLAISDRGLFKYKSYALISSAIENMDNDNDINAFIKKSDKVFKALGIESINKVGGKWVIKDSLLSTLVESGFKDNDDLLEFLASPNNKDLFQKNQAKFAQVHRNVEREFGSFDVLMHTINSNYKASAKKASPILAEIKQIDLVNNGRITTKYFDTPQLFVIPYSKLNAMNDEASFEHGEAMKFTYFSDSLLAATGYKAFKNTFIDKNLKVATEYLSSVDHVLTNKKISIVSERSTLLSTNFDSVINVYRRVLDKTTSKAKSYSLIEGYNVKKNIVIDLDLLGITSEQIEKSFSNVNELFEHSIHVEGAKPIIVSDITEANILKSFKEGYNFRNFRNHPLFSTLKDPNSFIRTLSANERSLVDGDFGVYLFDNHIGRLLAESNAYNLEKKVIDGTITFINKKNAQLYEEISDSMRTYLAHSEKTFDINDVRFKTTSLFNNLLSGKKVNITPALISEVNIHLGAIQENLLLGGSDKELSNLSKIVKLKSFISSLSVASGDPFASDTINSFFENKGFIVKEFTLGLKVTEDGSFIQDTNLNSLHKFVRSYEQQNIKSSVYYDVLENIQNKRYNSAIDSLTNATNSSLAEKMGMYDALKFYQKNIEIYKVFQKENPTLNDLSGVVKTLSLALKSLKDFDVDSDAYSKAYSEIQNNLLVKAQVFNSALSGELGKSSFANGEYNEVKRVTKSILKLIDSDYSYNNYFKNLFTSNDKIYGLNDRTSPFFQAFRERVADSVGSLVVKASGVEDNFLKILFSDGSFNQKNYKHYRKVFGDALAKKLLNDVSDEVLEEIKNAIPEDIKKNIDDLDLYAKIKKNLEIVNVQLKKVDEDIEYKTGYAHRMRHPGQTSLHFSTDYVVAAGHKASSSKNPFVQLIGSLTENFRNENTVMLLGDTTLSRMMGDYDSDKIYTALSDDINENFKIFDFHSFNNVDRATMPFVGKDMATHTIADNLDKTVSEFLDMFGIKSDDKTLVRNNINKIIADITETDVNLIKERQYISESTEYMFRSALNSRLKDQMEPELNNLIKDVFNKVDIKTYHTDIETSTASEVFYKYANLEIKNNSEFATRYSKFIDASGLKKDIFKSVDIIQESMDNFFKTSGILKTGTLYNYVLKIKSVNESLLNIDPEEYLRLNGNSLGDSSEVASKVRMSEKMYSASIQAIIGSKKGKKFNLNYLKSLVANIQTDENLSSDFDKLFKSVYSYYIDGDSKGKQGIIDFFKDVDIDEKHLGAKESFFDDILNKVFNKTSAPETFTKSHYSSTGLSILQQEYKFSNFNEVANKIKSGDFDDKSVKFFLGEFSAFFSGIADSQKIANKRIDHILETFSKNISSLEGASSDEVQKMLALINKDRFGSNIFSTQEGKAVVKEFEDIVKLFDGDEKYKPIKTEFEELSQIYKFLSPLEREDKNAFLVDIDSVFYKNQQENGLFSDKIRQKNFYDILDNKYFMTANPRSSLPYAKKIESLSKSYQSFLLLKGVKEVERKAGVNLVKLGSDYLELKAHIDARGATTVADILKDVPSDGALRKNTFVSRITQQLDKGLIDVGDNLNKILDLDTVQYKKIGAYVGEQSLDELKVKVGEVEASISKSLGELENIFNDKFVLKFFGDTSIENIIDAKKSVSDIDEVLKSYDDIVKSMAKYDFHFDVVQSEVFSKVIRDSDIFVNYANPSDMLRNIFNSRDVLSSLPDEKRTEFLNKFFSRFEKAPTRESIIVEMSTKNFDNFRNVMFGSDYDSFYKGVNHSMDDLEVLIGKEYNKVNKVNLFNFVVSDGVYKQVALQEMDFVSHVETKVDSLFDEVFVKRMNEVFTNNQVEVDEKFTNIVKEFYKKNIVLRAAQANNYSKDAVDEIVNTISNQRNLFNTYNLDDGFRNSIISSLREYASYGTEAIYNSAVKTSDNIDTLSRHAGTGLIAAGLLAVGHHIQKIRSRKAKEEINEELYSKEELRMKLEESFVKR